MPINVRHPNVYQVRISQSQPHLATVTIQLWNLTTQPIHSQCQLKTLNNPTHESRCRRCGLQTDVLRSIVKHRTENLAHFIVSNILTRSDTSTTLLAPDLSLKSKHPFSPSTALINVGPRPFYDKHKHTVHRIKNITYQDQFKMGSAVDGKYGRYLSRSVFLEEPLRGRAR